MCEKQQCLSRLASLLKAFGWRRKSLRTRSKDEGHVTRRINHLMCVVRKMSAVGRSDNGSRLNISQQLAKFYKQGWINDAHELWWEEWEVWLTQ